MRYSFWTEAAEAGGWMCVGGRSSYEPALAESLSSPSCLVLVGSLKVVLGAVCLKESVAETESVPGVLHSRG